jgi:hypothetical protein
MQRNSVHIEPAQFRRDQRRPAPRHTCTVPPSKGFFTLGFALVVLAASALAASAGGALAVSDVALAPTPVAAVAQSTQAVDEMKAEGVRAVVIGDAPAPSPNDARGGAKPQQ